jgi:hypothetical protein
MHRPPLGVTSPSTVAVLAVTFDVFPVLAARTASSLTSGVTLRSKPKVDTGWAALTVTSGSYYK